MLESRHTAHDPLHIVIVGGGVAALEALVALRALPAARLEVTLVCAGDEFVYRPLAIGEPFGLGHPRRYPLAALCRDLGADLLVDRVVAVDTEAHLVRTAQGRDVAYDACLLAMGARVVPAFEQGVTFDGDASREEFAEVLADLEDGLAPRVAIVIPDGVSWTLPAYELALLTQAWGERAHPDTVGVTVLTHEPAPLCAFGPTVSEGVRDLLAEAQVTVRSGVHADVVTAGALRAGGGWIEVDRIVAMPRLEGPHLAGVPCDPHGFVQVDGFSRVLGVEDLYAAGDGTTSPIKQGGLAAQQAAVAAAHIASRAGAGTEPGELRPVLRGLLRTRGGARYLRAELDDPEGTSTISEQPLWWPPSKIATRWLAPYLARRDAEQGSGRTVALARGR